MEFTLALTLTQLYYHITTYHHRYKGKERQMISKLEAKYGDTLDLSIAAMPVAAAVEVPAAVPVEVEGEAL
jgi:hypothetical protein